MKTERTFIIAKAGAWVLEQSRKNKKANRKDLIKKASEKFNYSYDTLLMILK